MGLKEGRNNPPFTVGHAVCRVLPEPVPSDLSGIFRVGLPHGHVGVLGLIGRFVNRKGLRLARNAELVFVRVTIRIHDTLMPGVGERKPRFL
jgi:hypothetical protein